MTFALFFVIIIITGLASLSDTFTRLPSYILRVSAHNHQVDLYALSPKTQQGKTRREVPSKRFLITA